MVKRFFKGFTYALSGLAAAFQSELNLRFHFFVMAIVCLVAFFFSVTVIEWLILILCFAFVISVELLNTALEKICNVVHPEHSPKIKLVKDISAAAVLVAAVGAAAVGLIVFLPKIYSLFNS